MALREYVFKTASATNLLCRWTKEDAQRWILVQLLRAKSHGKAAGAIFTIRAPATDVDRFLKGEFGKRYGTYDVLYRQGDLASVEVTNYLMPAYHGADPVELTTRFLGPNAYFYPLLVHEGYIHVRVVATPPPEGRNFADLLRRLSTATNPEDFQLIHTGEWSPLAHLRPRPQHITQRQKEVLKAAVEFGYYDEPRKCTLAEIASAFGVSKAAVHKQLVAVESKVLKSFNEAQG